MEEKTTKKPREFSKTLCLLAIILLCFSIVSSMACAILAIDVTIFLYIIPTVGGLTSISFAFYFFKAKAENLSKQRIRFVLQKLLLQEKLTPENYQEICTEIDNIDAVLYAKIHGMTEESLQGDDNMNYLPNVGVSMNDNVIYEDNIINI